MVFCFKCGQSIPNDAQFCSKCGTQQNSPISQSKSFSCDDDASSREKEIKSNSKPTAHYMQKEKTKNKKSVVGVSIVVGIVLVICIIFSLFINMIPKRVDFKIKFDQEEIQDFLEIVCKNANVESVQFGEIDIGGDVFTYGDFISAELMVKPHGKKAEEIEVRFYNADDTDIVSSIVIYYYDHDSENETVCRDAVVEALEISFCGSAQAKEYTSKFSSMGTEPATYDTKIVTDYSLTEDANVRITWKEQAGSPMFEWKGTYTIYQK